MELSIRPIEIQKSLVEKNPENYFILDGREIPSERAIPEPLRELLIPLLTGGSIKSEMPTLGGKNDFCQIISSKPAINPVSKTIASPQYAFMTQTRLPMPNEQFLSNENPFYIGILLNPDIPEMTLKEINIIVRVPMSGFVPTPMELLVNRAPVPIQYQLLGTHDILKEGQTEKNLRWEPISDPTAITVDSWSYGSSTKFVLLRDGVDPKYLTYRGFKFVVLEWDNTFAENGDTIPGISRLNFTFSDADVEALKKRPYRVPNVIPSNPDMVTGFDLTNLNPYDQPQPTIVNFSEEFIADAKEKIAEELFCDLTTKIDRQIEASIDALIRAAKDKVASLLSEKINTEFDKTVNQLETINKVICDDIRKRAEEIDKQVRISVKDNLKDVQDKTTARLNRTYETLDATIQNKVNECFANELKKHESEINDIATEILESLSNLREESLHDIRNRSMNKEEILDTISNGIKEKFDTEFESQYKKMINDINSHTQKVLKDKDSPLVKVMHGIQEAVSQLEHALNTQKKRLDDIIDLTTLVVVDDQDATSLNLGIKTSKNQYHVTNEKPHPNKHLELKLKPNPDEGELVNIFNLRTDGGKIIISGNGKTISIIHNGTSYDHLPKLALTEKGEYISLMYFNGIWMGRLESGVISKKQK